VEFLPRFLAVGKTRELNDLPILVHETLLPYQQESLEMAGIAAERLIKLEYPACYQFQEVIVPFFPKDSPQVFPKNSPPVPEDIRSSKAAIAWARTLVPDHREGRRKLFISRRDSKRRKVVNEDFLASSLKDRGFEICLLEGMSFSAQMELFSQAEVIVAAHGAGLGNLVFAPDHCRVIEIAPSVARTYVGVLAGIRGLKHYRVSCRNHVTEYCPPIFMDYYLTDQSIRKTHEILDMPL
jgi:capsular polysaccharide biosynthesis protein